MDDTYHEPERLEAGSPHVQEPAAKYPQVRYCLKSVDSEEPLALHVLYVMDSHTPPPTSLWMDMYYTFQLQAGFVPLTYGVRWGT